MKRLIKNMSVEEAIEIFSNLTVDEQKSFLAHFSHYLTVVARDAYEPGTENVANQPKMRRINEMQHRISSHLLALLENDSERYPDDVLIRIILEHSSNKVFELEIKRAFEQVAKRYTVVV